MERASRGHGEAARWKGWVALAVMAASLVTYLLSSRAVPIFWTELKRLMEKL